MSPWRVVRHRALGRGSASGSLARFELSAQARRRSEDLTPAASTTSERSAMLAHPSTELVARAPCQLRQSHARPVRAARARLRQQRRLEVDKTRKRGVQTGGVAGALERRRPRWLCFVIIKPNTLAAPTPRFQHPRRARSPCGPSDPAPGGELFVPRERQPHSGFIQPLPPLYFFVFPLVYLFSGPPWVALGDPSGRVLAAWA